MTATTSPSASRLTTTTSPSPRPRRQRGSCVEQRNWHAREDLAQAGDDAHPPARVQVRAELVDQHGALGRVDARPLLEQRDHQVGGQRDDRLVAVAQMLERNAGAERLDVDPPRAPVAHEPVVRLEPHEALERARDRLERRVVEAEQPLGRVADRREGVEEVLDAGQGRRRRRLLAATRKQPRRAIGEHDHLRLDAALERAAAPGEAQLDRLRAPGQVDADDAAQRAVADVLARVEAERRPLRLAHQCQRDGLQQRALPAAVLAEQHQPRGGRGRRRERRRPQVDVAEHLEVPHLDPLDPSRAAEVVLAGVRVALERVGVLRALGRVERSLDAVPVGSRDGREVPGNLGDGRGPFGRCLERRVELRSPTLHPRVEELAAKCRERPRTVEQVVEGDRVEAPLRGHAFPDVLPFGAHLLEGLEPGAEQLRAVEPEDLDRGAALVGQARDRAVLGVDEVLLGVVVARLEEERPLVSEHLPGRSDRCARPSHREAGTLEAHALGTARVEVLPGVREPPVVVGAERSVQGERIARGRKRSTSIACSASGVSQYAHLPMQAVQSAERISVEASGVSSNTKPLLRTLPGRALEERPGSLVCRNDVRRGERRWGAGLLGRADHARPIPRTRCAAAFSDAAISSSERVVRRLDDLFEQVENAKRLAVRGDEVDATAFSRDASTSRPACAKPTSAASAPAASSASCSSCGTTIPGTSLWRRSAKRWLVSGRTPASTGIGQLPPSRSTNASYASKS